MCIIPVVDDSESVECVFCYKQGDIQYLSSLDQQTCLFKGKFDTEYVLSTLTRAAESLKKHSFISLEVRKALHFITTKNEL